MRIWFKNHYILPLIASKSPLKPLIPQKSRSIPKSLNPQKSPRVCLNPQKSQNTPPPPTPPTPYLGHAFFWGLSPYALALPTSHSTVVSLSPYLSRRQATQGSIRFQFGNLADNFRSQGVISRARSGVPEYTFSNFESIIERTERV